MEKTESLFTDEIYKKLLKAVDDLPKEAVEKASKEVTRKGYDTTGYQYQFLVNVLNEVVGVADWNFSYKIIKESEGQWQNGRAFHEITVEMQVSVLGVTKTCVGGHKSEMYADALKGAITNSFKKTVAFFGVGKKAYEGTIDDDYRPVPNGNFNKTVKPSFLPKNTSTAPAKTSEQIAGIYKPCESCKKAVSKKEEEESMRVFGKVLHTACEPF